MAKDIFVKNKIAILGSGHIGSALAEGLIESGIRAQRIIVASPTVLHNRKLRKLGIQTIRDNSDAIRAASWIFLAVKPAIVSNVLNEIQYSIEGKVVISLATGINLATLKKCARRAYVARIMPNMPIAVNKGVIGYIAGNLPKKEKRELSHIISGLGIVIEAKSEDDIDIITLLSGCGPGIVSFLIAMLANNARKFGLTRKTANLLAQQTFNGTLAYLAHFNISPKALMRSVATKGGITESILADFAKRGLGQNFARAIATGYTRIKKVKNNYERKNCN